MGKAITKAKEIAAETKNTTAASAAGIATDKAGKALAEAGAAMAAPAAQEEPQAPAVTLDELEGMDDALWTQDEAEDAPRPAWRITDDGCADWACRKIAEEKADLDRIRELADAQIQKIEERAPRGHIALNIIFLRNSA